MDYNREYSPIFKTVLLGTDNAADQYPSIFSGQMATIAYILLRQMEAIVYMFQFGPYVFKSPSIK